MGVGGAVSSAKWMAHLESVRQIFDRTIEWEGPPKKSLWMRSILGRSTREQKEKFGKETEKDQPEGQEEIE